MHLPADITGTVDDDDQASLAFRDLLRGTATGLPSGEAVARHLGEPPLTPDEIGLAALGWRGETRSGSTSCARRRPARTASGWDRSAR
jgi:hypothetical protein